MEDKRKRGRSMKRSRVLRERLDESNEIHDTPTDSTDTGPTFPPDPVTDFTGGNGNASLTSENDERARRDGVWPDESIPFPSFDIHTLGTRTTTSLVETAVVVGKTDFGKDIITMQMKPVATTKIQPILNLEEAMSLGKRDWQPFPPKEGHWYCIVESGGQRRRFLIPEEIHQKVKDA